MSAPPPTAAAPASQRPSGLTAKRTRASASDEGPAAQGAAGSADAAAAAAPKRARVAIAPQRAASSSPSAVGLFFKSNNGNGLACLSNFWPFVQPNIARTVEARIAEVLSGERAAEPQSADAATAASAAPGQHAGGAAASDPHPAAAVSAASAAAAAPSSSSSSSSTPAPFAHSPPAGRDSFVLDGVRFCSVEHYYQSQKYAAAHPSLALQIAAAPTALAAKQINTKLRKTHPVDRAWFSHANQLAVMQRACQAKFEQNPRLAALLTSTADAPLHETRGRTKDVWTLQPDDESCDQLGKILMTVRQKLRQKSNSAQSE